MKLATFVKYGGSNMPRLFLHHAAWCIGEVRRVSEEEAKELKDKFPDHFEFSDTPPPAAPPEPVKLAQYRGPKPAEAPASDKPAEPAKE